MDLNRAEQAIRTGQTRTKIEECMYEAESGWYIIDGIEWVFDIDNDQGQGTNWRTNVKLVRREWPVPSKIKDKSGKTIDKKQQILLYQQILEMVNLLEWHIMMH